MEPSKIILSADSTCDLPEEVKERYNVHYYPFHIVLDDKVYQDNIDIHPKDLFDRYYEDGTLPTTGAMTIQEFVDYFKPFVDEGYEVIHLNLGNSLSSAHEHATKAAEELGNVYVVNSGELSVGMAPQIVLAGQMIAEGKTVQEILPALEEMRKRSHMSFVIDTMDFLAAGGRCPAVLAHAGKMLKLHPGVVVSNEDASMNVAKIYRGKPRKVGTHYIDDTLTEFENADLEEVYFVHTLDDMELIQRGVDHIKRVYGTKKVYLSRASCTISSHCGPNTIGLAFVTK